MIDPVYLHVCRAGRQGGCSYVCTHSLKQADHEKKLEPGILQATNQVLTYIKCRSQSMSKRNCETIIHDFHFLNQYDNYFEQVFNTPFLTNTKPPLCVWIDIGDR